MSEAEKTSNKTLTAYLCAQQPLQIHAVGDLPQIAALAEREGVSVQQHVTLDEALAHSGSIESEDPSPEQTGAGNLQVLVLDLQPGQNDVQQMLGKAVRAFPQRVIVHCNMQAGGSIEDADFYALGFSHLKVDLDSTEQPYASSWFEYRLSQYKAAPDWLNSRFWANPERYDEAEEPDIYCDDSDEDEDYQSPHDS